MHVEKKPLAVLEPHWIRVAAEDEAVHIGVGSQEEEGALGGQIRGCRCKL